MLYLYPLLLQSAKGVPFHPWLRGSIDGITPIQMRGLMSFRDRFRKGVFTNVFLHAKLEERYADRPAQVKQEVKRVFKKELFVANVRKMRKLVERLRWDPPQGVWTAYGERNSYTDDDARRKDEFVREVATSRDWNLVWDIGCNNGRYSRIAAEGARTVVAVDADQGPVELLYRDLRDEGNESILTLTMNLADPSPGLGWRGLERRSLPERGRPDLVLALALVHHVAISANDGAEAARAEARRAASRLRAGLLRADAERRVRGPAQRAPRVRHSSALLRAPQVRSDAAKAAGWAYLNLAVLWTFAVAQPLFDLLKDNPEFFAARGSSGFDIVSFAVLLVVLPPLVLLGIELLIGLAGDRARTTCHTVLLGGLVTLIAAQALKKAFDASDVVLIVLAIAIGAGLAVLWARAEPVRSFLNILSPVPLVFLLLFLFSGQISELAFPSEAKALSIGGVARAPIVVVLLDELPSSTLVDENDQLDAKRFPGFGELAKNATWFRNAYTVYDSTERAQPAIMDGNLPEKERQPISSDHPNSIFSLFGKTHRMNVDEEATSVCSRDLCTDTLTDESYGGRISSMAEDLGLVWLHVVSPPDIESELTSVSENWGNFGGGDDSEVETDASAEKKNVLANLAHGRPARFRAWVDRIERTRRPSLNFKHTLMPHVPWQYLPSGRSYRRTAGDAVPGLSNQAYEDQGQLDVLLQRHFLQTGFADYELQGLWDRLKSEGLWDSSLIVVAADHGVAFPRARQRRRLGRETAREIAPIPLFIKAPGQTEGKVDDAWVETIDILPTIFDVLNLDPRVKMDGRSAFSDEVQSRDELRFLIRNTFETLKIPAATFERERQEIIDRNHRLFGTGADGPDRIYRIGPHPELIGQPASAGGAPLDVELLESGDYENVDPASGFVPTHIVAKVRGPDRHPRDIAVAVNGTIRATGNTFTLAVGYPGELVSVMVPESAFKKGRNEVEVLQLG
jgi:hypothetical protein